MQIQQFGWSSKHILLYKPKGGSGIIKCMNKIKLSNKLQKLGFPNEIVWAKDYLVEDDGLKLLKNPKITIQICGDGVLGLCVQNDDGTFDMEYFKTQKALIQALSGKLK